MSKKHFPKFDRYICVGDTRTIERDGFEITARIEHDAHSTPDDADCYSERVKAAHRRDEWQYIGVVLSVSLRGVVLHDSTSLWGIECNLNQRANACIRDVADELLDEALDGARAKLDELLAARAAA